MQCAIAFLLLAAKNPKSMDRLVVTHSEANKPSYGVYELKTSRNFPDLKLINQPDIIWKSAMKNGTHMMSYCSNSLQSHKIARKITSGLTEITPRAHLHWNEDTEAEMNCLKSLQFVNNPDETVISKLPPVVKKKCTNQVILNLAFQGIVGVNGAYRKYAPPMAEQPVVVTLDQPMKLSSLMLDGKLMKGNETVFGQEALAWYQGHLHLFKRNRKRNAWLPVTTIGHEIGSGWLITNFIYVNFPEMINIWENYYEKTSEFEYRLREAYRYEEINRYHTNTYWGSRQPRDYYENFDGERARNFEKVKHDELKKLHPWELATSRASGITMAI